MDQDTYSYIYDLHMNIMKEHLKIKTVCFMFVCAILLHNCKRARVYLWQHCYTCSIINFAISSEDNITLWLVVQ